MSHRRKPAWRRTGRQKFVSLAVLAAMVLQLVLPLSTAAAAPAAAPQQQIQAASANAAQSVQALFIHNADEETAGALSTILGANGVNVEATRLQPEPTPEPTEDPGSGSGGENPDFNNSLFLPNVSGGSGPGVAASGAFASMPRAEITDLHGYDVILLGADLEQNGGWSVDAQLTQQIMESGRPVIGMGRGGALFFDQAGAQIGLSNAVAVTGRQVSHSGGNAGLPLYTGPNALPTDGTLDLYSGDQSGVAIPMASDKPGVTRYAAVAGAPENIAVVTEGARWALWGFGAGPQAMTETGQQLLANLIWLMTEDDVTIPLASGQLTPDAGVEPALQEAVNEGRPQYALVQLYDLPTPEMEKQLADLGVTLLGYLANKTYRAEIAPNADLSNPDLLALLRFAGSYKQEYKVSPDLQSVDAADAGAEPIPYEEMLVIFFDNVSAEQIKTLLAEVVGENYRQGAVPTEWIVPFTGQAIEAFSAQMIVRFITPITPPRETNDNGLVNTNSDDVQNMVVDGGGNPIYLGLSGKGITVAQFERRPDASHPDLGSRINSGVNAHANISDHATHVAGIILGNGSQSASAGAAAFQWRGHAPEARLVSQSYGTDVDSWSDAINTWKAVVSNHSYVQTVGTYDGTASTVDTIVRGDAVDSSSNSIPARPAVYAVANQGTGAQYDNEEGFYSIYAPAKNSIGVGSVDSNDSDLSGFSSRGPTFDGRIKPDIVAPGSQGSGDFAVTSTVANAFLDERTRNCINDATDPNNGDDYCYPYDTMSGTSMAAPAVTGIVAQMMEQYGKTFGAGNMPLPSTIKAILVNTATDLVDTSTFNDPDCNCTFDYDVGPDWGTGYGLVNAQAAVGAVRAKSFLEGDVAPGAVQDEYTIQVTAGQPELRFTLAWDDEPGDTSTAETTAKLVNDLDLLLIAPDNTQHLPWVLDPLPITATPGSGALDPISQDDINNNPARRDVNTRDNVEQVVVDNPMAGTWTIRVRANALPNNNTQKYSLAGDFRTINIVEPQTGNVAEAGDPNNPNVILVVVEASQPYANDTSSSLVDAAAGDFQVEIEGTAADVINGLAVGDQFWLNVRPASGVYAGGSKYDLTVSWLGHGADTETRAVLFTEREVTDRAIVLDHSYSMVDYDKMDAAQNAARLFVDQSLPGDRIAVVGFSTNASVPYAITEVSNNPATPELNAAKAAVDGLIPTASTAIGKGLLEGQNQVTAAPADFSLMDVMILLSDGMENVTPYYDTPAVKGVIEPTDTIVHTVAVGPASQGHHALLQEIADDNGGEFRSVTEDGSVMAAGTSAAMSTGIDAMPLSLPNRLGDVYKQLAEEILFENRLFQARSLSDPKQGAHTWRVNVPDGLTRITFALNWQMKGHMLTLTVVDPEGKQYQFDPKNDPACRDDMTHQVCIIEKPAPGTWQMLVNFVETTRSNEYMLWVSAKTPVNFNLAVATPPAEQVVNAPIHILGFLSELTKPLVGQTVVVNVYGPANPDGPVGQLQLMDDGQHGDGKADDGIYGGYFTAGMLEGAYAVRGVAQGTDIDGDPFQLFDTTGFHLRPKIAYIFDKDEETAAAYRGLIQRNGIPVDTVQMQDLAETDFSRYSLIIVGPDTGRLGEWGDEDKAPSYVIRYERPVLGLGEGGYAFFGKLGLALGYPNGAHGSGASIRLTNFDDVIWKQPYEFDLSQYKFMQLYKEAGVRVDIFLETEANSTLELFGMNDNDERYADLAKENGYWTFWGFQDGPQKMTDEGMQLFINTVHRAMP